MTKSTLRLGKRRMTKTGTETGLAALTAVFQQFNPSVIAMLVASSLLTLTSGCQSTDKALTQSLNDSTPSAILFTEQHGDITLEQHNRRKWDNAVIADLDNDGYPELLLTDHGYSIKVYWNDAGQYQPGVDLIVGDTHGISMGDINADGKIDILVSRGGGSGTNARNSKLFHVEQRTIIADGEMSPPLPLLRGRTNKLFDADNNGSLDMLLMGFPSMNVGKRTENFIYQNDGLGNLTLSKKLPQTYRDGQKVLISDFNHDSFDDLLIFGNGNVMALQSNGKTGAALAYRNVTKKLFSGPLTDVTGIAEIDYDNDGDFDLYFTRSKDLVAGDTFYNESKQTFGFFTKRGAFQFDDLLIGDTFNMLNYQAPYPDQNIYIGESGYQFTWKGEKHRGRDINIVSSDALGWPDKLTNKGIYIGYVGNGLWRIGGNTHSPTSGVVTDVKAYKATKPGEPIADLLLANVDGKFVDVTQQAGLNILAHSSGSAIADVDNNGYQDIVVIKRGELASETQQILWLNQGNGQFKSAQQHGIVSHELGALGAGVDAVDYNRDGLVDIVYGNERGQWHLYKNQINNPNHHVSIWVEDVANKLHKSGAKVSALGAKVEIAACGQRQVKRVAASAAPYSQSFNPIVHFGVNGCKKIDNVKVTWSTGQNVVLTDLAVDKLFKTSAAR